MVIERAATGGVRSLMRSRFDQLEDAIRDGDIVTARELAQAVRREYVVAHDGFRDAIAATLSHAVDVSSPEEGEAIGRRVVEYLMQGGDPPQYTQPSFAGRLKAIAAGWHWHATSFTLSEDDEKFTFHLGPCGSGMRLLREGAYDGEGAWHRSETPSPSNFMQVGFPMYSNHCAEMTRMALMNGSATFIVEGWTPMRRRGICIQHTYKDPTMVSPEVYERVGLIPPLELQRQTAQEGNRLLSQDELDEIATHPLDRLIAQMARGNDAAALSSLDECRSGWRDAIHDVYRRWLSRLWAEVEQTLGHDQLVRTLEITAPELIKGVAGGSGWDWAAFWSIHLRLRDVRRTDDGWDFVVGAEALLQPDEYSGYPGSVDQFCHALNRGMRLFHRMAAGSFESQSDSIVHHFAASAR